MGYGYDDHSGSNYGIGYRTSMTDGSGAHPTSWEYDNRGHLAKETKWIDSTSFLTQWTYNSADLPDTMTYPDGEVVTNHYNNQILLTSVVGAETYASALTYDSANRLQAITLGSNLGERLIYKAWTDQSGRLDTMVATTADQRTGVIQVTPNATTETIIHELRHMFSLAENEKIIT